MLLDLATTYFGPAQVLQAADKQLLLELPEARAWANTSGASSVKLAKAEPVSRKSRRRIAAPI